MPTLHDFPYQFLHHIRSPQPIEIPFDEPQGKLLEFNWGSLKGELLDLLADEVHLAEVVDGCLEGGGGFEVGRGAGLGGREEGDVRELGLLLLYDGVELGWLVDCRCVLNYDDWYFDLLPDHNIAQIVNFHNMVDFHLLLSPFHNFHYPHFLLFLLRPPYILLATGHQPSYFPPNIPLQIDLPHRWLIVP
jgi:hypothetical protein